METFLFITISSIVIFTFYWGWKCTGTTGGYQVIHAFSSFSTFPLFFFGQSSLVVSAWRVFIHFSARVGWSFLVGIPYFIWLKINHRDDIPAWLFLVLLFSGMVPVGALIALVQALSKQ